MPDEPYRQMPIYRRDGSIKATVLVSETDFAHVSRWRWTLDSKGYVKRNTRVAGSRRSHTVKLHREVLGLTDPRVKGDHINGNQLDNRRSNLRPGTHAQNLQNRPRRYRGSQSRYRGVSWYKASSKWSAQVRLDGHLHHLGRYLDELDAARAAEAFRRQHMPFAIHDASLDPVPRCRCPLCR